MTTELIDTNIKSSIWIDDLYQDTEIQFLEKAVDGRTTLNDITSALDEYKRLHKAGIVSPAEMLTLSRAYPDNTEYQKALRKMKIGDDDSLVVGGPASIELIDREGHLITTDALGKAFTKYMANFRTRNAMVLHSDVQVGWALPAYISKGGQIFKSGVDDKGLFFITELRNDTKIAKKVKEQIDEGKLKSYSIAGSATKTQTIQKGLMEVMQVDEMELAEVTVCEKGVNQGASFDILKASNSATSSCVDGSCLIKKDENCDCGCNSQGVELMVKSDGDIDFTKSFLKMMGKEDISKGIEVSSRGIGGSEPPDVDRSAQAKVTGRSMTTFERYKKKQVNKDDPIKKGVGEAFDEHQARHEDKAPKPAVPDATQQKWAKEKGRFDAQSRANPPIKKTVQVEGEEGKAFATLHNTQGRQEEHHRLLDRYGFPDELEAENARYTPVIEEMLSPFAPMQDYHVNEAGEHLGERHYDDALTTPQLKPGINRGVVEGGNSSDIPVSDLVDADAFNRVLASSSLEQTPPKIEITISKADSFFDWMEKETPTHIYKESCGCEKCFKKTTDNSLTFETNNDSFLGWGK